MSDELTLDTITEISRGIQLITTLTRYLLQVTDDPDRVLVHVGPLGRSRWCCEVSYEGFVLRTEAMSLAEAVGGLLRDLTTRVADRVAQGQTILDVARSQA